MLAVVVLVVVVVVVLVVLVVAKLEKVVALSNLGLGRWSWGLQCGIWGCRQASQPNKDAGTATPKDTRSLTSGIP